MNPSSSLAGRPPKPSKSVIPVTQRHGMGTPLPSAELPNDDPIEAPDPTERHRIQSSPDSSSNDRVNDHAQAPEPFLNTSSLAMPGPIPGFSDTLSSSQTSSIHQNSGRRAQLVRPTTGNSIADKPEDPIANQNDPLHQAVIDPYHPDGPFKMYDEDSGYFENFGSATRYISSSHPRAAPAPEFRTFETPSLHGLETKIRLGTCSIAELTPEAELLSETPRYPYDDSSHCKRATDVKSVKACLDATKAGKPLKMLVTSCTSCREGKTRCHRNYPQCLRCKRLGLVCKWENT